MPNWCMNSVYITGPSATIQKLAEALKEGRFCQTVLPVPEPLLDPETSSYGGENAAEKDALRERLKAEHGYSNWYDFCCDNWGTKWDVEDSSPTIQTDQTPATLAAWFESAWSPPEGIYSKLVEQGCGVVAYYFEPGMGFAGVWRDGTCDHYEFRSKEDIHALPHEIFTEMDILNWYEEAEEWEEEA